jgi:hypothetical protein
MLIYSNPVGGRTTFWAPLGGPGKLKDQRMRYSRKLANQLYLLFGYTYSLNKFIQDLSWSWDNPVWEKSLGGWMGCVGLEGKFSVSFGQ